MACGSWRLAGTEFKASPSLNAVRAASRISTSLFGFGLVLSCSPGLADLVGFYSVISAGISHSFFFVYMFYMAFYV